MVLELIHKFRLKLLCIALVIMLCGCDGKYGKYPYDKASQWICSDPEFTIEWVANEHGSFCKNASVINLDNTEILVDVNFYSDFFDILPADSNHYDKRLLTGKWKIRDGKLILLIKEDFIFNNQYSELVFSSVP